MGMEGGGFNKPIPKVEKESEPVTRSEDQAEVPAAVSPETPPTPQPGVENVPEMYSPKDDPALQAIETGITERVNREVASFQTGQWGSGAQSESNHMGGYSDVWDRTATRVSMQEWDKAIRDNPDITEKYAYYEPVKRAVERGRLKREREEQESRKLETRRTVSATERPVSEVKEIKTNVPAELDVEVKKQVGGIDVSEGNVEKDFEASLLSTESESWDGEFENIQQTLTEDERDVLSLESDERVPSLREKLNQARGGWENLPSAPRDEQGRVTFESGPKKEFARLRLFEDAYKEALESASDESLDQEFMSVSEQFIKGELAAGATLKDLELRHFGPRSLTKGSGAYENLATLASVYLHRDPQQFVRQSKLFEEALSRSSKTLGSDKLPNEAQSMPLIETRESLKKSIIEDLSYQDVDVPLDIKQQMLEDTMASESANKYAESLAELSEHIGGFESVGVVADKLVEKMSAEAERLGIPVSPFGKSRTWAIWDMGKQYYYFTHPNENDSKYPIGDPFSEAKSEEIVNRHLGWEAYGAYNQNEQKEFLEKIPADKRLSILGLLKRRPKDNGTLSSKELAELGALLRSRG